MTAGTFVAVLLACASSILARQGSAWESLYSSRSEKPWLAGVWLNDDRSWMAGGIDQIVVGRSDGVRTIDIAGYAAYSFGKDDVGGVYAVGSRQAVWQLTDAKVAVVHSRPGPPRKGRSAASDVLYGIDYLDPDHPQRLVAFGPGEVIVSRDPGAAWVSREDAALSRRISEGPRTAVPSGCNEAGWRWLDRNTGLRYCHDLSGYLYVSGTATPVGRLPADCGTSLVAVARDGADLYVACGIRAKVWRRSTAGGAWNQLAGIEDVRALHARHGCVIAGTGRTVFRRCELRQP